MPRSKAHYTLTAKNHVTGELLKVDLIDLPWTPRLYRLRVNGKAAGKLARGQQDESPRPPAQVVGGALAAPRAAQGIRLFHLVPKLLRFGNAFIPSELRSTYP